MILTQILFLYCISFSKTLITLPFKEIINKQLLTENNLIDILDNSIISTTIKLGTPIQSIPLIMKSSEYAFHISNESCNGNVENKFINTLSTSYKEDLDCYDEYIYEQDELKSFSIKGEKPSIDNFYLGKEEKIVENLGFLLTYNLTVNQSGILGMGFFESRLKYQPFGFIKQLKQLNVIKQNIYSFSYFGENEGNLIIGEYPHIYKSEDYLLENFRQSSVFYSHKHNNFDIKFNGLFYGENKIDDDLNMEVTFDNGLIKGTDIFRDNLDKFIFNDLIEKKECERNISNEKRLYYVCNNKRILRKFESIKFYLNEQSVNLTISSGDLFYKNDKDGKYYFLIYFNQPLTKEEKWKQRLDSINNKWILGRKFFKTFLLVFDQDKKIMGFYKNKLNQNIFSKGIFWPWTLVFVCISIIFVLIFYIFSIFKKIRKKRVNELDLYYDYTPYKVEI
jgi:hypothetical protein